MTALDTAPKTLSGPLVNAILLVSRDSVGIT